MGRPKVERRKLTDEEQAQVTKLIEDYYGLAIAVARRCMSEYQLWGDGFREDDVCEIALDGLCEGARDYVEKGYESTGEPEKPYLAKSVQNQIVDFVRKVKSERCVKVQVELEDGMIVTKKTCRFVPFDERISSVIEHDEEEPEPEEKPELDVEEPDFVHEECTSFLDRLSVHTKDPSERAPSPLERLKDFAKTLPAELRVVQDAFIEDREAGQRRAYGEMAKALGISRSELFRRRCALREYFKKWHLREYYD